MKLILFGELERNLKISVKEPESINERIDEDIVVKGVTRAESVYWPHQRQDCTKSKPFQEPDSKSVIFIF